MCSHAGLHRCQLGQDESWNITWPPTDVGVTAKQKCPGSSETNGIVVLISLNYLTKYKKTTLNTAVCSGVMG